MAEVSLQEAFDFLDKRVKSLEAMTLGLIDIHKMTLRGIVDLELVEGELVARALRELAERHSGDEFTVSVLNTLASLPEFSGDEPDTGPNLRLVKDDDA